MKLQMLVLDKQFVPTAGENKETYVNVATLSTMSKYSCGKTINSLVTGEHRIFLKDNASCPITATKSIKEHQQTSSLHPGLYTVDELDTI